ncbi:hypothetical protein [Gloeocapsopsis sp. IPPAS B-1203]|uniref:hypothetical protein n=1 Tax=Gloeocapsopsis sp. IPPAS B-1203 TaxID=2049454 RepID=UPI000C178AC6|nr:hypothetical protein [Gloeocapsopsis sp. IPPAS B-1203]PIG92831.1 hypothetical protein CSQ79_14770 [Gloeocapsopsis sp. IPPAS B-1203]
MINRLLTQDKQAKTISTPPLESGDRLTRHEFERRYTAIPDIKKAELIEGVRSHVFPGLWLAVSGLLEGKMAQVLAVLQQGLNSPEHAEFVQKLTKLIRLKPQLCRQNLSS